MTEAEARALLNRWSGSGAIEDWIIRQAWSAEVGGWRVARDLQGWHLQIEVIAKGLRITAKPPSGSSTVWIIAG